MKRTVALLSIALMIGTAALAQNRQFKNRNQMAMQGSDRPDRMERIASALELSDEQKSQIEAIQLQAMKASKSVRNQIGEKEARLKTLTTADAPDNKQIAKVAREIGDLRTEIFVNRVETKQKVRALLNEKQKLKFDTFQEKRRMSSQYGKRQGFSGRGGKG